MSVTPDELRKALKYSVTRDRTITQQARTLAAAYREAIEALRELNKHTRDYQDHLHQMGLLLDADYEMSSLGTIDANLYDSLLKAWGILAKAKEAGVE